MFKSSIVGFTIAYQYVISLYFWKYIYTAEYLMMRKQDPLVNVIRRGFVYFFIFFFFLNQRNGFEFIDV